jgi:hypothetical protein
MANFKLKQNLSGISHMVRRGCLLAVRDPHKAIMAVRIGAWVLVISGMVKVLSLPRLLSIITPRDVEKISKAGDAQSQLRLAQLTDQLLNLNTFVFTPTCWKRAAVLYRYLALNGIRSSVIFGVRKEGEGQLVGHAWLEVHGDPVLEPSPPDFHVTYTFPPQSTVQPT